MEYFVIIIQLLASFCSVNAQYRDQTVMYILENTQGLQTFGSWCSEIAHEYTQRGGSGAGGNSGITVFAFNDTSYNNMASQDKQVLMQLDSQGRKEYVRSYTVNGGYAVSALGDNTVLQSVRGRRLYINKKLIQSSISTAGVSRTFVNGAMIVRENIQASNGIIHVVDRPPGPVSIKRIHEYIDYPDIPVDNSEMRRLMERLVQDYYSLAIAPLTYEDKMTFLLPAQQALQRIPDMKLNALAGMTLAECFQMHYIPKFVVFTNVIDHQQSFSSGTSRSQIIFKRNGERGRFFRALDNKENIQ